VVAEKAVLVHHPGILSLHANTGDIPLIWPYCLEPIEFGVQFPLLRFRTLQPLK